MVCECRLYRTKQNIEHMKKLMLLPVLVLLCIQACKKDEPKDNEPEPQSVDNPADNIFTMKVGNYWVYETWSSQDNSTSIDTVKVIGDTTVNGKTFYRFNTLAPLTFMGGVEYQLADSSGYIIDPTGFVYEVNNGAQDTIRVENFSAIDVVVKTGNRDTLLNVPAGSFHTLQTIGDTYYTGMASPTGTNPRHSGNFAAKNVGCISINYFYANSPYHFITTLQSYHLEP